MLHKKMLANGQKARQREDHEDREWQYRDWLRTFRVKGFFMDIDMFQWRIIDGKPNIIAVHDITRTDKEEVSQHYLDSISHRIFIRDTQGRNLIRMGEILSVPVFLILFPKSVKWMWVLDFSDRSWKKYSADEWANYLKNL